MDMIEIEGRSWPCSPLEAELAKAKAWVVDPEGIPFLIIQVMNDQENPYMMIRALDGTKIRLVNSIDYPKYKYVHTNQE